MIQFNLLPDVKLEYIKAQKMSRLILAIAFVVSTLSLVVLILLIVVNQFGKKHLADLSHDIMTSSAKLQKEPNLNNILTVQNQLESLTKLHGTKPAVFSTFDYLNRLTPAKINITNYQTDLIMDTVTITGTSDALSTVNQFVDTLKLTTYSVAGSNSSSAKLPAFNGIVLSAFGLTAGGKADQAASFSIAYKYDPLIYDITKTITLNVPNRTPSRTGVIQPTDLFSASPSTAPSVTKPTGSTR